MKINLIEYFAETAVKFADKIAVINGEQSITFADLDKKARALAQAIINTCDCKNKPIALFIPKCIEAVWADLAITYSGNTYMNLDVKNPAERLRNILNLIQPAAIITNNANKSKLDGVVPDGIHVINMDEVTFDGLIPSADDLLASISDWIDTDPY